METETTTWSQFPNGGKANVEQRLASEERNKSKRAGLWVSVWDLSRKVNHMSKVIWDRKIIIEFTRPISSTRIDKSVLMRGVKVSKDKTLDGLIERTSFMSDEIESKPCTKRKKVIDRGKRSKTLSESIESIESSRFVSRRARMSGVWFNKRFTINKIRMKASSICKAKL